MCHRAAKWQLGARALPHCLPAAQAPSFSSCHCCHMELFCLMSLKLWRLEILWPYPQGPAHSMLWSSPFSFLYFLQCKPEFSIRSSWFEPQSVPGLVFFWLYRVSPSSTAKNITNLISVKMLWWCPCVDWDWSVVLFKRVFAKTSARLDESQTAIKIARRNINNLRYADDTTLMQ